MKKSIADRIYSYAYQMYFVELGMKFRPGSMKKFLDLLYVIFEKFAYKFDFLSKIYPKLYDELVEKEINMAKIKPKDIVLVIGCGSLPITSAIIASKTNAKIIAIDLDKKAIINAEQFFKSQNLDKQVKVELANGLHYPVDNFDVIFVLQGVQGQNVLLPSIATTIKNDARIVFRSLVDGYEKNLKEYVDLSKYFIVADTVKSEILYPVGSYLLKKKI